MKGQRETPAIHTNGTTMHTTTRLTLIAAALSLAVAACTTDAVEAPEVMAEPGTAAEPADDEPAATNEAEPLRTDDEQDAEADASPPDEAEATQPDDVQPSSVGTSGFDVRFDGASIEVVTDEGRHAFELASPQLVHAISVRPDPTADHLDVVVIAVHGERPVLHGITLRGTDATFTTFPSHLQPQHEVDAAPPAIDWTPDGRSIVWTEPAGDGVALRTVGWNDGPGTGRPADDNATFALDLAADAHVDGFEVTDDDWTLLLRPGAGGDPIELRIERQADGALALPYG